MQLKGQATHTSCTSMSQPKRKAMSRSRSLQNRKSVHVFCGYAHAGEGQCAKDAGGSVQSDYKSRLQAK